MNLRSRIVEIVENEEVTRSELCERLQFSQKCLSSQFTYLRWSGVFITTDENKRVIILSKESYDRKLEDIRLRNLDRKSSIKTTKERIDLATKRLTRFEKSRSVCEKRYADNESEENGLRFDKSKIEIRLAMIELDRLKNLTDDE